MRTRATAVGVAAAVALAAVAFLGLTRDDGTTAIVTQAQADATLSVLYQARDDRDALCALGTAAGNCRALIQGAGTAPSAPPSIVCSAPYEGDGSHAPGLIVRIHVTGAPEDTESMVLSDRGQARFMNPVYWNGARVSEEGTALPSESFACQ